MGRIVAVAVAVAVARRGSLLFLKATQPRVIELGDREKDPWLTSVHLDGQVAYIVSSELGAAQTSMTSVPGAYASFNASWYLPPLVPWFEKTETACTPSGPFLVAYVELSE